MNNAERELLIKEIVYRASRRGTKELDLLFQRFTEMSFLRGLDEADLARVVALLKESEADLMRWFVEGGTVPERYVDILVRKN